MIVFNVFSTYGIVYVSKDISQWILEVCNQVCDLEWRLRKTKTNLNTIRRIMADWCLAPLYQRREDKKDSLLAIEVFCNICNFVL